MKILAIDASTKSTGIAIFEDDELIDYQCITASSTNLIKRIHTIIQNLNIILTKQSIDKVILEEVRPDEDDGSHYTSKTYRALMWLQAAINFFIYDRYPKAEVIYVYPSEWRKACGIRTGRGIKRETVKEADIKFVKDTYNLTVNDDIADAIGIGHWYTHPIQTEINWG